MEKSIINWIKSAEYDIKTAEAMFKSKRYVYVVFMCHLSIEKILKALVTSITKKIPPKTHDLGLLIRLGLLEVPEAYIKFFIHLNGASIPTRYPEDMSVLGKQYNKKIALRYLTETKVVLKWLKKQIK